MWASNDMNRASAGPLASNLLLKQLGNSDQALLDGHLQLHNVTAGTVLFESGELLEHAFFPMDTIVALEQACGVEVALAGREGMLGWTAFGGFCNSPYRAVVRGRDGQLLKMSIAALNSVIAVNASLRAILAQYVVVTAVQMAEGLGAHAHHRLESAIARWLLMRHDRVGGDWIHAQHQEIADCLGARRASVTDCLHILEGDMHVRCRRGRILIRNRGDLEARATGAYGAAEALYRASIGAFGKSPGANLMPQQSIIECADDAQRKYA